MTSPPEGDDFGFTHKALSQNPLPYKNPGDVKEYLRRSGNTALSIEAGKVYDGRLNDFITPGIPYGGGARLALFYIMTEAIRRGNKHIELGNSFTSWANELYGVGQKNGRKHHLDSRQLKRLQDQMARIASCSFTLGYSREGRSYTDSGKLVKSLELWTPKDETQRVLWPSYIVLGEEFYNSLHNAKILVDLRAIMHLAGKPMAMDIYTWLAQRLYRISSNDSHFIAWTNLKEQFCQAPDQAMNHFKKYFRSNLQKAIAEYPESRSSVQIDGKGLTLTKAMPPIPPNGQTFLL